MADPLQEVIAKALLEQINSGVGVQRAEVVADTLAEAVLGVLHANGWVDDPYEGDAQGGPCLVIPLTKEHAKKITAEYESGTSVLKDTLISLGVLRADDDTRYVAITRNYWHRLDAISDRLEADGWRLMAQDIRLLVAAYDAVAPNAKDHA